jgi:hypothetical protein
MHIRPSPVRNSLIGAVGAARALASSAYAAAHKDPERAGRAAQAHRNAAAHHQRQGSGDTLPVRARSAGKTVSDFVSGRSCGAPTASAPRTPGQPSVWLCAIGGARKTVSDWKPATAPLLAVMT